VDVAVVNIEIKIELMKQKVAFIEPNPRVLLSSRAWESDSILRVLAYFDIFFYPLKKEEIFQFMDSSPDFEAFGYLLGQLVEEQKVYQHHGLYSLNDNPLLVHRRRQGSIRAARLLTKAQSVGKFLYQFPFVRGIAVSGSLSKDFADQHSDIDFFIITKRNRMWIARSLMQVYTKVSMLVGRGHLCCMNYYIDEEALELCDQNIFTAIELKTLLPVAGEEMFTKFFAGNEWVNDYLPNCEFRKQQAPTARPGLLKRVGEWLFNSAVSNSLDNFLFRTTTKRWRRKEHSKKLNSKGDVLNLMTGKHFARTNPGAFQEKILQAYHARVNNSQTV
jgi:predicted nucleotidyltransferase